jgi:hypothetical protein
MSPERVRQLARRGQAASARSRRDDDDRRDLMEDPDLVLAVELSVVVPVTPVRMDVKKSSEQFIQRTKWK